MVKRKIVWILAFVLTFIFAGCAPKQTCKPEIKYVDKIVEVEVPVMIKPTIKRIPKPSLPIKKLSKKSTPSEVAEAYYNSLKIEIDYANKLENILSNFYEDK